MAYDPVCHEYVDQQIAKYHEKYKGREYYFCCPRCKAKFEQDPERYAGKS